MLELIYEEAEHLDFDDESHDVECPLQKTEMRTLNNLIKFVLLYTNLIFEETSLDKKLLVENKSDFDEKIRQNHKQNRNNPKMIDLL